MSQAGTNENRAFGQPMAGRGRARELAGVQPYPADFVPSLQIGAHSLAVLLLPPITARAGIGKQGVGQ